MKRIVSMFLIMFSLIFSLKTILSFHYCHGELETVVLHSNHNNCCEKENPKNIAFNNGCCDQDLFVLNTDIFSIDQKQYKFDRYLKITHQFLYYSFKLFSFKTIDFSLSKSIIKCITVSLSVICVFKI